MRQSKHLLPWFWRDMENLDNFMWVNLKQQKIYTKKTCKSQQNQILQQHLCKSKYKGKMTKNNITIENLY